MNTAQSFNSIFVRSQLKEQVCSLCLSQNRNFVRNVFFLHKIQEDFPKLLLDFDVQEERICWECHGRLKQLVGFQNQIKKARDTLNQISFNAKNGYFTPKIISLSSLKQTTLRGEVIIEPTSHGLTNETQYGPPLQYTPIISVTSRMPIISSVTSLSQTSALDKPNTVPTLMILPTEIKTEVQESDCVDVKNEPLNDDEISSHPPSESLDLDEILESMYVQKPQKLFQHPPDLNLLNLNRHHAPHLKQPLLNAQPKVVAASPNILTVTSGPSLKTPIGKGSSTSVAVLSKKMVFELRERERIYLNNLKTGFNCDTCVLNLKSEVAFKAHMMRHEPQAGPEVCDICELRFRVKECLNLHYKSHFRAYSCGQCRGKTFVCRHWNTMELHLKTHDNSAFCCDECGVAFRTKELLKEHKNATHMIDCPKCKYKYSSQASLDAHTRFHHVELKCQKCYMIMKGVKGLKIHQLKNKDCDTFSSDKNIVMLTNEDGKPQSYCGKCNKFFKDRLYLMNHLKSKQHYDGWFECDYCGKKYSQKFTLGRHIQFSHMKTSKCFTCETCGKEFQYKKTLNHHVHFVHLKKKLESKYCCDVCGKAFTSKRQLTTHQLIHSGVRAYQCDLCPWNFTQKSTLYTHMKLKHKDVVSNSSTARAVKTRKQRKKRK